MSAANQRRQEPSEDCSSLAYSTVKACSATNSEVTATTTKTRSAPKATHVLCGQSTCSGDTCGLPQEKRSVGNSTLGSLVKRGKPEDGEPPGPEDYNGSVDQFVAKDTFGTVVKHAIPEMGDVTTSSSLVFRGKVEQIAITGLYGCTSVIAISKKGVFVSHTYERHMADGAPTFQEQVIQGVHRGLGNDYHPFGIDELTNNPDASPDGLGTIFGDNRPGADNNLDVHVYIVTPRLRMPIYDTNADGTDKLDADGFPVWVPDEARLDENALPNTRLYPGSVTELLTNLDGSFKGSEHGAIVDIIDYAPNVLPKAWHDKRDDLFLEVLDAEAGEATLRAQEELDKHRASVPYILGNGDNRNARGKVLVQYRPAHGCNDRAGWRVWAEGRGIQGREHSWKPRPGQVFEREGAQKRQESCDSMDEDDSGNNEDDSSSNEDDSGNNEDDSGNGDDSGNDDDSNDEPQPGPPPRPPPGAGVRIQ